jgi:hypothetical protein
MYWELSFDFKSQAGCLLYGAPEELRRGSRVVCSPYEILLAFVCAVYLAECRRKLEPDRLGKASSYRVVNGVVPIHESIVLRQFDGKNEPIKIAQRDVLVQECLICDVCEGYTCECSYRRLIGELR